MPDDEAPAVRFSTEVFDLDTVKRAAYRLSGACSFDFSIEADEIVCRLLFSPGVPSNVEELKNALRNEVLDQDLRQSIAAETADVRNAVLAYAFSRTGLQGGDTV